MIKCKSVNLACGGVYVTSNDWINLDYASSDVHVRQANLLETLPFDSNSISLVYSSHFLEHIPLAQVPSFLKECYRILKPGGIIRLVLPDFEEMCHEYISQLHQGDYTKARLCIIDIIDQCVRLNSGGQLAKVYEEYSKIPSNNKDIIEYIYSRSGQCLPIATSKPYNFRELSLLFRKPRLILRKIASHLNLMWIRIVVSLLPKAFRQQNISFSGIGERHQWLWDFISTKKILEEVGFDAVSRFSFNTSQVCGFPFEPLDVNPDGRPRKGKQSMYLEATKPCLDYP
ncbi:methyltransferase domain-containing protein [Cylindrospermopsis raciborskii]|uniref:class I SAM-dependent methyltransferase n=1 Tax=Cylindrospermopsis raciborskii TaxID=77022 RepID=UPI0022C6E636|nr:methyltransferase domain-containing protein [Cylindrospermopsis raciborskii]MCZ2207368.1 methyltransferase domain-containing protein [Cylindrospermopsis raciborskii PAMP2011]